MTMYDAKTKLILKETILCHSYFCSLSLSDSPSRVAHCTTRQDRQQFSKVLNIKKKKKVNCFMNF